MLTDAERIEHRRLTKQKWDKRHRATKTYMKYVKDRCALITRSWTNWMLANGYEVPTMSMHYHHKNPDVKLFTIGTFIKHRIINPKNTDGIAKK